MPLDPHRNFLFFFHEQFQALTNLSSAKVGVLCGRGENSCVFVVCLLWERVRVLVVCVCPSPCLLDSFRKQVVQYWCDVLQLKFPVPQVYQLKPTTATVTTS